MHHTHKNLTKSTITSSRSYPLRKAYRRQNTDTETSATPKRELANDGGDSDDNKFPPMVSFSNTDEPDGFTWSVKMWDGKKISAYQVSTSQLEAIELKQYDYVLDYARATWAYRDQSGEWIDKGNKWRGLGKVTLSVIEAIQDRPGFCCTALMISIRTGNENLADNGNIARHVTTLRRIHGEVVDNPHYFITQKIPESTLMWPRERTWIRIKQAIPSVTDDEAL